MSVDDLFQYIRLFWHSAESDEGDYMDLDSWQKQQAPAESSQDDGQNTSSITGENGVKSENVNGGVIFHEE